MAENIHAQERSVRLVAEGSSWGQIITGTAGAASDGIAYGVKLDGDGYDAGITPILYNPASPAGGSAASRSQLIGFDVKPILNPIATDDTLADLMTMIFSRGTDGKSVPSYNVQTAFEGAALESRVETGFACATAKMVANFENHDFKITINGEARMPSWGAAIGGFTGGISIPAAANVTADSAALVIGSDTFGAAIYTAAVNVDNRQEMGPYVNDGGLTYRTQPTYGLVKDTITLDLDLRDDTIRHTAMTGGTATFSMVASGPTKTATITAEIIEFPVYKEEFPVDKRARRTITCTCIGTGGHGTAGRLVTATVA